jgi:hypothetical protein
VAGIPVPTGGDGSSLDWLLSQREIVIRHSKLRWDDEMRKAPELVLEDVNLILHNRWLRHRLSLRANPPQETSAPLDVSRFQSSGLCPQFRDHALEGRLHADLRSIPTWRSGAPGGLPDRHQQYAVRCAPGSRWTMPRSPISPPTSACPTSTPSCRGSWSPSLQARQWPHLGQRNPGANRRMACRTFGANGHQVTSPISR